MFPEISSRVRDRLVSLYQHCANLPSTDKTIPSRLGGQRGLRRIRSRMILFALVFLIHVSPVFAQLDAGFSSLPLEGGTRNDGFITYQWQDSLSTSFRVTLEGTATNDEVAGFPDSLLVAEGRVTNIALYPIEYRVHRYALDLTVGAGASYNRRKVTEKGNFVFVDPQLFNNEYLADRYGVSIRADVRGHLPPLTLQYATFLVPLYFLSFQQDISIQPLVSEVAAFDTTATGGLAWHQTAKIGFWQLVQLETTYEVDVLSFDILRLSTDGSQYLFETAKSDTLVQTFRGFINLLIPVADASGFSIGGGFQYSTITDRSAENSQTLEESRWIYKLEYGRQL
jgi:hypothetical protein